MMFQVRRSVVLSLVVLLSAIFSIAAQASYYIPVTADNSVILANVLGKRENFEAANLQPICFIKIHNIQMEKVPRGVSYVYEVEGCKVSEFRGFGVCKTGGCVPHPFQVRVLASNYSHDVTLENLWLL